MPDGLRERFDVVTPRQRAERVVTLYPDIAQAPTPHTARPRRVDPEYFIRTELGAGKSIEQLRAATLAELAGVNDGVEHATDAKTLAAERKYKTQIEERLAAIEERRKPAVAYYDAVSQYEAAVAAIDVAHAGYRADAVEQARFWRNQVDVHGKRLAEEQVEHDMRAFDLDAYRRGLEATYAKLAENEDEYADTAPELLEMAFIQQKMAVFAARMESAQLQRRLHVERERSVMKRTLERTGHAIAQLEKTRKTLNWLNPFHWKRIVDVDDNLARMRKEQEYTRQKYAIVAVDPVADRAIGIRMPDTSQPQPARRTVAQRNVA